MNVLLVSNYYPPEKGAASNRIYAMAKAFKERGHTVEIVCPLPNYPTGRVFKEYKGKLYSVKQENGIKISRLWVIPSNSKNKLLRLFSMLSFSLSLSVFMLFRKLPPVVLVQYSPVFVGSTAVLWSNLKGRKVVLNISDIWPLAGYEMGLLKKGFYYKILEGLERFCIRKSNLVLGQSEEILNHVKGIDKNKPLLLYRNIPTANSVFTPKQTNSPEITLFYAGLLGIAQGLLHIVQSIDWPQHVHLHIFGAGPEAKAIEKIESPNIHYHGEVTRAELHTHIQKYDCAFVPLVKRIYGSVPSKIFEYSVLGYPIVYFAGGEGGELVVHHRLGWTIPVGDITALQSFLNRLDRKTLDETSGVAVRERAKEAFDFNLQFDELIENIEEL